jgi:hypothetical protein
MIAWIVQLESGVWLCVGKGDPCRTLKVENAYRFDSEAKAARNMAIAQTIRPFTDAKITQVFC